MVGRSATSREDIATLRTIGDVAEALDLPQHVLRFWETRFKEIDPVKRAGGRRFYRPRDIELVETIRHLLYSEGYTIKGVQRILKEQGVDAVMEEVRRRQRGEEPLPAPAPAPALHLHLPLPSSLSLYCRPSDRRRSICTYPPRFRFLTSRWWKRLVRLPRKFRPSPSPPPCRRRICPSSSRGGSTRSRQSF